MTLARFDEPVARPLWLITLADLSLLLLGFFVFLQAARSIDEARMVDGVRQAFGGDTSEPAMAAMPVDLAIVGGFASGSALVSGSVTDIARWLDDAARDPRTTVTLTGVTGSASDVDPRTGSRDILAIDRARAVAAQLVASGAIDPARLRIGAAATGTRGHVALTIGFTGSLAEERP
ncbi:flagellar motor protein MotB [Sphingomonas japonica]|uniref:Flagellar motor protein MotB n=1 Tax=Sphingomonas japonica TaxID=511662 RepID=A0ABX0U087_9SPHN|nr:flagellar motor protein MotB [Sphingomonas japonica]NIJ23990.1 flagellar motor protein MotB [Sphingomonas japonica]